jgi:hypothetical protein
VLIEHGWITQLPVFHRGWTAGRHTAEEAENLDEYRESRRPNVEVPYRFRP